MPKSVCVLQGHPHSGAHHFCHALADSYAKGAEEAGASVSRLDVGAIQPVPLTDPADFAHPATGDIADAQQTIRACDHLVVVFPLWLGAMPSLTRAFFEQLGRGDFLIERGAADEWPHGALKGRSARVITTMGMPAFAYRMFFGAHGVRSLESSVLHLAGINPIRETLIGRVETMSDRQRDDWLDRVETMGRRQM